VSGQVRAGKRIVAALSGLAVALCVCFSSIAIWAQAENERSFDQPKAAIEKLLKEMQGTTSGRLPVLDGFATSPAADHPLDRYKRGYYQAKFQVSAGPSGGSMVRVSIQVTAWYNDPAGAKSGYQVLTSNGRLEADLLDQLSDQLAAGSPRTGANSTATASKASKAPATTAAASAAANEPTISAPAPRFPDVGKYSSPLAQGLAEQERTGAKSGSKASSSSKPDSNTLADKTGGPLQTEADGLEEILKNQAHPKNLVAVKKSGTPVVASASLTARTLFMASAHDEFEILDFNRDWVHVKISGLSRGWIWRNNLEMPDSVPDTDAPPKASEVPPAADIFHVSREETAPFPGDWAPLRGKSVKIVSVEKIDENAKDAGPQLRLEYAKFILEKDYPELAQKSRELFGIVLIFDSADGGMIAATFPTLQQWKAGKLSDAALWHQCFFDPPETFTEAGAAGSQ
jgi:hypothetical protein